MKALLFVFTLVLSFSAASQAQQISINEVMTNAASTHEELSGLKNFRVVIPGVLYRGGNSGGGQMPLNETGLKSLADKGFSSAVYMYPTNWDKKPSANHGIDYTNFGPTTVSRPLVKQFLTKIKDVIENKKGPLYVHCWNGWHASGEMSSYALIQFCGFTPQQAQQYWFANAPNGQILRIGKFEKFEDLNISSEDAARVCPR